MDAHQKPGELMYDARMMRRLSSAHGSPSRLPAAGGEGAPSVHENNYVAEAVLFAHETATSGAR